MEGNNTNTITEKTTNKKTGNIPQKDKDFLDTCKVVLATWKNEPEIKLKFTNVNEFETTITNYESAFGIRTKVGSTRPEVTKQLKQINKKITSSVTFVKHYIAEKYTKQEAVSYYPQFGLVQKEKVWKIPMDQNQCSHSLDLMIEGIQKHGFNTKTYGKTFWSDTRVAFNNLRTTALASDQTVATQVSSKNENKKILHKTIKGLIGLITSNNPDTYKSELRKWGFQKEKY